MKLLKFQNVSFFQLNVLLLFVLWERCPMKKLKFKSCIPDLYSRYTEYRMNISRDQTKTIENRRKILTNWFSVTHEEI